MITKGVTSQIPNTPELYSLFTSGKWNRIGQCFLEIHNYSGKSKPKLLTQSNQKKKHNYKDGVGDKIAAKYNDHILMTGKQNNIYLCNIVGSN